MRFKHDSTLKALKRLPMLTTEGLENPPLFGQLSTISRINSPDTLAGSSDTLANIVSKYVGGQILTAEYDNIKQQSADNVDNNSTFSNIFGTDVTHSTRTGQHIHDIKTNGPYLYVLWSCQNSAPAQFELILTRLDQEYQEQESYVVAYNKNQWTWTPVAAGALSAATEFILRTAVIIPDLLTARIYVAFIQRKEVLSGDYTPNFGSGTDGQIGLKLWRGNATDFTINSHIDIQQPAADYDVSEVDAYMYNGSPDLVRLAWVRVNDDGGPTVQPYLWEGEVNDTSFTLSSSSVIKSDFANLDTARLPQILEVDVVGSPEPVVFYSHFIVATNTCKIRIRRYKVAPADYDQAICTYTSYQEAAQYYAISDPTSTTVALVFYDREAGPIYKWKAIRKTWNTGIPLETQDVYSHGVNDYGGHVEGIWDDTEATFTLAYPRYTAPGNQYRSNNVLHLGLRDPLNDLSDYYIQAPGNGGMLPANKYSLARYQNKVCSAYNAWDGVSAEHIGVSAPGHGGIYCSLSLNSQEYSSFSEIIAYVMGLSSRRWGTGPEGDNGIQLLVWDNTSGIWSNLANKNMNRGLISVDSYGVGVEHPILPTYLEQVFVPFVTEYLHMIICNNNPGTLRDPVGTEINFIGIQGKDDESAIIASKDANTLGQYPSGDPSHGLALIEYEAYDDTEQTLLESSGIEPTVNSLDLTIQRLIQPFYFALNESMEISQVQLYLNRTASVPTDTLLARIARIYAETGDDVDEPKDVLATSYTIDQSTISQVGGWFTISFPTPAVLHPGTLYCILLDRSVPSAAEYVSWRHATTALDTCASYLGWYTASIFVPDYNLVPGGKHFTYRLYGKPKNAFSVDLSRNGGGTWKPATLDKFDEKVISSGWLGNKPDVKRYLVKAQVDFRDQPSGTNPQMRVTILGNKNELRTLALHWR